MLADIELKITNIEGKKAVVAENIMSFRELERITLRYLIIARRLGLPEEIGKATAVITSLVIIIRMADIALTQLERPGITGLLIGIAGILMVGLGTYDMIRGGS